MISVIIPSWQEASSIVDAVHSAWELDPHEVIVADGGSNDGTAQLAEDAGATVVATSKGRGPQLNAGVQRATGKTLLFLHADCWLAPDGAAQLRTAVDNQGVRCGSFQQTIEAPGGVYRWLEKGNAYRAVRWQLPYGDQGIFMTRSLYDRVGGFPEEPIMEDLLLMRQVRKLTKIAFLPGPLHVSPRRWQHQGVVRQTVRNWTLVAALDLGVKPTTLARWY